MRQLKFFQYHTEKNTISHTDNTDDAENTEIFSG